MGIPYSKEINAAFDQVTPLVASAYEVLDTTKNIAIFLACLQVLISLTLLAILLSMIGLLFTVNPDLEHERQLFVTPVMKWIASWSVTNSGQMKSIAGAVFGVFALAGIGWAIVGGFALVVLGFLSYVYYIRKVEDARIENGEGGDTQKQVKRQDVEAIKKGDT